MIIVFTTVKEFLRVHTQSVQTQEPRYRSRIHYLSVSGWSLLPRKAQMLLPPSELMRSRMRTLTYALPKLRGFHIVLPASSILSSTANLAAGANSKASPVFRLMISSRRLSSPFACLVPARWPLRASSQCGEAKRWTKVMEQRSISRGDTVGSGVAITARQARCL